jgi:hypothetical protein
MTRRRMRMMWAQGQRVSLEWRQMQTKKMGYRQRFKVWFTQIWARTCSSV